MAFAAITGDYGRAYGVKADNVRQTSPDGVKSFIELDLVHGDVECQIVRGISGVKTTMVKTWPGGTETFLGDDKVTRELEGLLGDKKLLDRYVFPAQAELTGWISATLGERATFFERLFKLEQAKRIAEAIGKHSGALAIADVAEELAQRRQALQQMKGEFTPLDAALLKVVDYLKYDPEADPLTKMLRDYDRKIELRQRRAEVAEVLAKHKKNEADDADDVEQLTRQVAERQQELEQIEQDADTATGLLAAWDAAEAARKSQEKLEARVKELGDSLKRRRKPDLPAEADPGPALEELMGERARLASKLADIRKELEGLRTENCPTCGSPATQAMKDLADRKRSELTVLDVKVRNLDADVAATRKRKNIYDDDCDAYDDYTRFVAKTEEALLVAKGDLADANAKIKTSKTTLTDPDRCREQIALRETARRQLRTLRDDLTAATKALATSRAGVEHREAEIARLREQIAAIEVTAEDADAAAAEKKEKVHKHEVAIELDKQMSVLEANMKSCAAEIKRLKQVQADNAKLKEWKEHLGQLSNLFRDLPRIVSHQYLELLADECNSELSLFNAGFVVTPVGDLSFRADFMDGRQQVMQRLSWGQRVALAISFLVAVNTLFAKDIGLLWLDEPTEYLDEERVKSLRDVLLRMRERAGAAGLQIVMITHMRQLRDLFDKVIFTDKQWSLG